MLQARVRDEAVLANSPDIIPRRLLTYSGLKAREKGRSSGASSAVPLMTRGMSAFVRLMTIFSLRPDLRRWASACSRSETILIA